MRPSDIRRVLRARRAGIVNPLIAWQEARRAGLEYALACALLDQETGGGENVFGHDPTIFVGAGRVTRAKYLRYRAARRAGKNQAMQGVGPCQLTWWATQDEADRIGGCWRPRFNMRVGFSNLAHGIQRSGKFAGVRAYNGSGSAAEAYAKSVLEKEAHWHRILAGE